MAAQQSVSVMSGLAIMAAVEQTILPAYRATGRDAKMIWDPTTKLIERIDAGERADLIIAIKEPMDELAARGIIVSETRLPLVRALVGAAVRAGAAIPIIATVSDLRHALLAAASIVYSRAGASGIYFEKLIDRLGIGAEIRAKSVVIPAGLTAEVVARGEAEMAIQQVSELMAVPGVELVGSMPAEVQANTDFDLALFTGTGNAEGARSFAAALRSDEARHAYEATGLKALF
ncbi:MAG TPA: substrate-binding domain-containing protein [Devosia sp.]|nr:substrate-binding domain-containing protein [Devosia sp.]